MVTLRNAGVDVINRSRLGAVEGPIGLTRFHSQIREVINRNTIVSLALEKGFNAYLPVYDGGVDFILYREEDGLTHKVQLKSRWIIDRKYVGRGISVAFPNAADWYLVPHDIMVQQAEEAGFTKTPSWMVGGAYSCRSFSETLAAACEPYRFMSIAKVSAEAADDT